jgi:hypothetical protein
LKKSHPPPPFAAAIETRDTATPSSDIDRAVAGEIQWSLPAETSDFYSYKAHFLILFYNSEIACVRAIANDCSSSNSATKGELINRTIVLVSVSNKPSEGYSF